ncbi:MAG: lytic transglycosylase domain-containing protein [Pseudomonadota bacterium]
MRTGLFRRLALACLIYTLLAPWALASEGPAMAQVMQAIGQRDWPLAAERARRVGDPVARTVVDWHRLRAGQGRWQDYAAFLSNHGDWPGLALMRRRGEAVLPSGVSAAQMRGFFADGQPQTGRGALLLAAALSGADRDAVLVRAWRMLAFSDAARAAMLERHGRLLAPHHAARMEEMLWAGRTEQAEAMLPLVGRDRAALARARIALQRTANGVDGLIAAVPPALSGDPGLAHDRFAWRMRKDRYDSSEALLVERSVSRESLGRPEAWADRRRLLARRAMRQQRPVEAYNLASRHALTEGSSYADLEWLSGYLALTYLNDPSRAVRHFERFRLAVATPISLGRAGYWIGRAEEAGGNANAARAAYGFAAAYQTSFYGQLAAERAGLPVDRDMARQGTLPDWQRRSFANSTPVRAAFLFRAAGQTQLMRRFLLHVEERLDPSDAAALAKLSLDLSAPYVAVSVAKRQARKGVVLPEAYYPVTDLAAKAGPVRPELAMAIARQESELNPAAVSPVGARGLMQLMPGTARKVAGDLGLPYDLARLTRDPDYNARLGTTYLAEMLQRWGGSTLLAAVSYNAGPHRADAWIKTYGDPRSRRVDPIHWIEHIPFRETRNYTMRILEALHVYRLRMGGRGGIGLGAELGLR